MDHHALLDPTHITGLILAGGQGSRMGGADKGLQLFNGQPLVSHVLGRLQQQVGSVLISANRNLAAYQSLGVPVIPDVRPDYPGPLAGVHAALHSLETPWLFTCPCDAPQLSLDLVAHLSHALNQAQTPYPLAVARFAGHLQPTFMLCHRDCLSNLEQYLDQGERRVGLWQTRLPALTVPCDLYPESFQNLNTLEQLAAAQGS